MEFYGIDGSIALADEIIKLEKIAWRVTADAEFGKYREVGFLLPGPFYSFNNFPGIIFEITNVIVLLR
jgi:hypothetical protein